MLRVFAYRVKSMVLRVFRNRWVLRLTGVGILVLILLKVDLGEAWRILRTVEPRLMMLALVFQAMGLVAATLRWQLIMRRLEIHVPFSRSFVHQLIGTAAAMVTPGQLGEFVKVLYHRREGFPVPESLLSVLIDRAYDLMLLLLFGFIAVTVLFGVPTNWAVAIAVSGSVVFILAFLFTRNREESAQWIARALARITPQAYKETVHQNAHRLARRIGGFKLRFLLGWGLLSIVNYVFLLLRIYAVYLAVHIEIPFWYCAMVVPLNRLVGLIPISVSGIGTRNITTIYLLGQIGIAAESALIASALVLITVQVQALLGLMVWWRYPLRFGKAGLASPEPAPLREDGAVSPGR